MYFPNVDKSIAEQSLLLFQKDFEIRKKFVFRTDILVTALRSLILNDKI